MTQKEFIAKSSHGPLGWVSGKLWKMAYISLFFIYYSMPFLSVSWNLFWTKVEYKCITNDLGEYFN